MTILASLATLAAETGLEDVGYTAAEIKNFNPNDKLGKDLQFPDMNKVRAFTDSIIGHGLPSVSCSIDPEFLNGVKLSSTYGSVINILSTSGNEVRKSRSVVRNVFLAALVPNSRRSRS